MKTTRRPVVVPPDPSSGSPNLPSRLPTLNPATGTHIHVHTLAQAYKSCTSFHWGCKEISYLCQAWHSQKSKVELSDSGDCYGNSTPTLIARPSTGLSQLLQTTSNLSAKWVGQFKIYIYIYTHIKFTYLLIQHILWRHTWVYVCSYVSICMCVCVCIYVYFSILCQQSPWLMHWRCTKNMY